jgi:hypothetical protein
MSGLGVRFLLAPPSFHKGACSKAGELVSKTDWVGSIPTALATDRYLDVGEMT